LAGSGTTAFYLLIKVFSTHHKIRVIFPNITCETIVNACVISGFDPIFVDIQGDNHQFDEKDLKQVLEAGPEDVTNLLLLTHLFGPPVLLDKYFDRYPNLQVIEDAAQVYGKIENKFEIGKLGIASIISFGKGKNFDCGEGGAILTDDDALYEAAKQMQEQLQSELSVMDVLRTKKNMIQEYYQLKKDYSGGLPYNVHKDFLIKNHHGLLYPITLQFCQNFIQSFDQFDARIIYRQQVLEEFVDNLKKIWKLPELEMSLKELVYWRFPIRVLEEERLKFNEVMEAKNLYPTKMFYPLHTKYSDVKTKIFPGSEKYHQQNFVFDFFNAVCKD
jgi:dTDP-4-amino-4,6-dideoxygalactose transaminase